ncbi:hypothetical protein AYO20_07512 [Fonsecaea nubica]|uniref:Uncharacterized protein n=1 Tax=Fonsecaea nubica TaxID=856822 RepID=A0A178CWA3_9EURO|nr:hypothetical protein AYO20_07512 [Fonsecaea nubica]OAL33195.1 hypothetical protein AYO20_07512 [Fonsecaea nubica]
MISYQGIVAICIASAAALVTMGFVVHRLLIKRPDVADPFTPSDDQRRYMREVRERNIVEALGDQRLRQALRGLVPSHLTPPQPNMKRYDMERYDVIWHDTSRHDSSSESTALGAYSHACDHHEPRRTSHPA